MKREEHARTGLGVPSLVLILLVLCLALLGVLALLSARSDYRMSLRFAELAADAAQAEAQAERILSELDAQMADAWLAAADDAEYAQRCREITLVDTTHIDWRSDEYAAFVVDAGASRVMNVEIERCGWGNAAEKRYVLIKYALEDTNNWEQTESLLLMDM